MEKLYHAEVFIAAISFVSAAIIFGFTPWHRTIAGRALFLVLTNFAIILTLIVTSFWIGDYAARDFVRTILYTLTMINGVVILIFVIAAQIIGTRKLEENYGKRRTDYTG